MIPEGSLQFSKNADTKEKLLEESKTRILSCCGNEYYFPSTTEKESPESQVCLDCNLPITNHY